MKHPAHPRPGTATVLALVALAVSCTPSVTTTDAAHSVVIEYDDTPPTTNPVRLPVPWRRNGWRPADNWGCSLIPDTTVGGIPGTTPHPLPGAAPFASIGSEAEFVVNANAAIVAFVTCDRRAGDARTSDAAPQSQHLYGYQLAGSVGVLPLGEPVMLPSNIEDPSRCSLTSQTGSSIITFTCPSLDGSHVNGTITVDARILSIHPELRS